MAVVPGPRWQFYACELTTGNVVVDLSVVDFSGEVHLNGKGPMSCQLPLAHLPYSARRTLLDSTIPGRHTIVGLRDGIVRGEWIVWKRQRGNDFGAISLSGNEVLSFAEHRMMWNWSYSQVDQLDIAYYLLLEAFAGEPGSRRGKVAMIINPYVQSGQLRDRSWNKLDGTIGQRVRELSEVDGGFDYVVTPEWRTTGTTGVDRHLQFFYPRAGSDQGMVLEMAGSGFGGSTASGGNILSLDQDEDGATLASWAYAIGATPSGGTEPLIGQHHQLDLVDNGYPFMETTASYSSVSEQSTIDGHAKALWADKQRLDDPVIGPILADVPPKIGDYALGDLMTVHLDPSVNYPDGYHDRVRVLGWTHKPADTGPATVILTTTRVIS